ncbi:hypothetical protein HZH68_012699 [Vespula germanica]|uniref:Odorant receptor n=1 Tax=Vespula germanica TaxID=30212 RepID=A0A834MXH6_VESGE|nr:hypothetical protein HZH68_012699 [Vespula germanica]
MLSRKLLNNHFLPVGALRSVIELKICLDAAKVRYTIMSRRSQTSFEQHFLFSNRLTALVINPNRSLNNQLFLFCAITIYLFPIIVHQMKLIFARIECDYLQLVDEKLFNIIQKYTKQSKRYTYIIVVFFSLYIISMTFPSILNVLLYIFGALDDTKLTLPFTNYDGLIVGPLYYNLLIYQLIGALILLTIGTSIYSSYLVCIQHACCQFSLIIVKIREQFKIDKKYTKMVWNSETLQNEHDWIIDIIKHYRNVTE